MIHNFGKLWDINNNFILTNICLNVKWNSRITNANSDSLRSKSGLQLNVRNRKLFFLFLNQNICCECSKEPSQWDGSFENPKHMFRLLGKKIIAFLRSKSLLNWLYGKCRLVLQVWTRLLALLWIAAKFSLLINESEVWYKIGLIARKPVFGVSDKARLKPVYSARKLKFQVWPGLAKCRQISIFAMPVASTGK